MCSWGGAYIQRPEMFTTLFLKIHFYYFPLCIMYLCGVWAYKSRQHPIPWNPSLQAIVSPLCAGDWNAVLCKDTLNHWAITPASLYFIIFWNKVSHQIQTGWPVSPRNKLLSLPPICVLLTLPFLCMCARNPNSGPSCLCGKHFSDWAISPALGF